MYRTTFGIELRLHLGNELIESRLSRYGEAPLLLIAEQAKQNLLKDGWTELPLNATPSSRDPHEAGRILLPGHDDVARHVDERVVSTSRINCCVRLSSESGRKSISPRKLLYVSQKIDQRSGSRLGLLWMSAGRTFAHDEAA